MLCDCITKWIFQSCFMTLQESGASSASWSGFEGGWWWRGGPVGVPEDEDQKTMQQQESKGTTAELVVYRSRQGGAQIRTQDTKLASSAGVWGVCQRRRFSCSYVVIFCLWMSFAHVNGTTTATLRQPVVGDKVWSVDLHSKCTSTSCATRSMPPWSISDTAVLGNPSQPTGSPYPLSRINPFLVQEMCGNWLVHTTYHPRWESHRSSHC